MFVTFRTILGYRKARKYRRDYVGYLFQDYALIPDQTVYDNINLAARPNKILPTKAMLTQIAQALDQVGLAGYERRQVCELSGGEQQRVAIARLLVRPPKVVLADEPTGALDHDNSLRVIAHLRDLAAGGASVVVATHSDLVADSADQHIKVAWHHSGGATAGMRTAPTAGPAPALAHPRNSARRQRAHQRTLPR